MTVRSCLVAALLFLVILPAAGVATAVWLFFVPTASEAEAAKAYRSAPICTAPAIAGCISVQLRSIGRLLRNPQKPLPSYPDYEKS